MRTLTIALLTCLVTLSATPAWSSITKTEVSQLYIAIFGRASEGEANTYWQKKDQAGTSMTSTADTMLNTDAAKSYFGADLDDNRTFIALIYNNTLGKTYTDDPEGIDYWVRELEDGKSKGQIIAALIAAVQLPANNGLAAQNRFNNKTAASDYCADTVLVFTDLATFRSFISTVTDDDDTVVDAKLLIGSKADHDDDDDSDSDEHDGDMDSDTDDDTINNPDSQAVIFTNPRFGEFCTDPLGWVDQGYSVGIWSDKVTILAEAVDSAGKKITGDFTYAVVETGETGAMLAVGNSWQAQPTVPVGQTYNYTVSVNGSTSDLAQIYRAPAKCDNCHASPPGHIALEANWGRCRECHDLGVYVHTHAVEKADIADNGCYECHPSGCLDSDVHATKAQMFCTDCHGQLSEVLTGTFKISGMAGKPQCADCHSSVYSETGTDLFVDSSGHGEMLCVSCHNAPHRIVKPGNLGDGSINNCSLCHAAQVLDSEMGADCGSCHTSSWNPHIATDE